MVHTFTSIRAVLSKLSSIFPQDQWNEDDVIEWAASALMKMKVNTQMQPAIAFTTIKNYRAKLPKGLVKLEQVAYKKSRSINVTDLERLKEDLRITNEAYYDKFVNLTTKFNYIPVKKATSPFSLQKACEDCNDVYLANLEYTLLPTGCLHFSISTGDVCIAYLKYPQDDNGDFLIPDDEDVIDALTYYCCAMIWQYRMNMKEENAFNMFDMYLGLYETKATKAKGKMVMPDIDTMQNIKDMTDRFFPASNRYHSFFGNLNSAESPTLAGRSNIQGDIVWF
jgi:hypothetical protein